MSTNTTQPKSEKKTEAASCCGGKTEVAEKPHQHVKPQDQKTTEKSSCCCK